MIGEVDIIFWCIEKRKFNVYYFAIIDCAAVFLKKWLVRNKGKFLPELAPQNLKDCR